MAGAQRGVVYLVGAGPGDPDLLTQRAAALIQTGTRILHDGLVAESILALAAKDAWLINVGKRCGAKAIVQGEINALLVEYALKGESVIRLKSGDAMLFGRAAEEMSALETAGAPYEVVPGISAAFAAACSLRISLTDRTGASKLVFLTAHRAAGAPQPLWSGTLPSDATLAIYMPGKDYGALGEMLLVSGLSPETPCVVVSHAGRESQRVVATSISELPFVQPLPAPSLILAGRGVSRKPAIHEPAEALTASV